MWPLKSKSPEIQIEQVEMRLRSFMPGRFHASYDPAFPGSNEKIFKWFQVVFEVGPGEDSLIRTQVNHLFERILPALSELNLVCESDYVSLRARRHYPDSEMYNPNHPFMFVEADWSGSAIRAMREQADFTIWTTACLFYRNCRDQNDPLTKNNFIKSSSLPNADI